jgi:hypothetical protein
MLRIYLDLCSLKRPFDKPRNERIRLEAEAVVSLLKAPPDRATFVHCKAQDLENAQNPVAWRAQRVLSWLISVPLVLIPQVEVETRARSLVAFGLSGFDAIHVASAEISGANVLATCDDRLISRARQGAGQIKVRVTDPVSLALEVFST